MKAEWELRLALEADIPALEVLIRVSVRSLQAGHYSPAQMEAALGPVFGVDRQLIDDGTYFVAELDPARVRAFFVHPDWARRGIGRSILTASEEAIRKSGFKSIELVATLAGEPLCAVCGYEVVDRYDVPIPKGFTLPVVRMAKRLNSI